MAIKIRASQAGWQQQVLVPVLRAAERGVVRARHWSGPALDRLQLYLKAWRTALDPATAVWIEEAKRSVADGTAAAEAWTTDDLRRMVEERRKLAG